MFSRDFTVVESKSTGKMKQIARSSQQNGIQKV